MDSSGARVPPSPVRRSAADNNSAIFVSEHIEHLNKKLNALEAELLRTWKTLEFLSCDYLRMTERLETVEMLLDQQQATICRLVGIYHSATSATQEAAASTSAETVAAAASVAATAAAAAAAAVAAADSVQAAGDEPVPELPRDLSDEDFAAKLMAQLHHLESAGEWNRAASRLTAPRLSADEAFYRSLNSAHRDSPSLISESDNELKMIWESAQPLSRSSPAPPISSHNTTIDSDVFSSLDYINYRKSSQTCAHKTSHEEDPWTMWSSHRVPEPQAAPSAANPPLPAPAEDLTKVQCDPTSVFQEELRLAFMERNRSVKKHTAVDSTSRSTTNLTVGSHSSSDSNLRNSPSAAAVSCSSFNLGAFSYLQTSAAVTSESKIDSLTDGIATSAGSAGAGSRCVSSENLTHPFATYRRADVGASSVLKSTVFPYPSSPFKKVNSSAAAVGTADRPLTPIPSTAGVVTGTGSRKNSTHDLQTLKTSETPPVSVGDDSLSAPTVAPTVTHTSPKSPRRSTKRNNSGGHQSPTRMPSFSGSSGGGNCTTRSDSGVSSLSGNWSSFEKSPGSPKHSVVHQSSLSELTSVCGSTSCSAATSASPSLSCSHRRHGSGPKLVAPQAAVLTTETWNLQGPICSVTSHLPHSGQVSTTSSARSGRLDAAAARKSPVANHRSHSVAATASQPQSHPQQDQGTASSSLASEIDGYLMPTLDDEWFSRGVVYPSHTYRSNTPSPAPGSAPEAAEALSLVPPPAPADRNHVTYPPVPNCYERHRYEDERQLAAYLGHGLAPAPPPDVAVSQRMANHAPDHSTPGRATQLVRHDGYACSVHPTKASSDGVQRTPSASSFSSSTDSSVYHRPLVQQLDPPMQRSKSDQDLDDDGFYLDGYGGEDLAGRSAPAAVGSFYTSSQVIVSQCGYLSIASGSSVKGETSCPEASGGRQTRSTGSRGKALRSAMNNLLPNLGRLHLKSRSYSLPGFDGVDHQQQQLQQQHASINAAASASPLLFTEDGSSGKRAPGLATSFGRASSLPRMKKSGKLMNKLSNLVLRNGKNPQQPQLHQQPTDWVSGQRIHQLDVVSDGTASKKWRKNRPPAEQVEGRHLVSYFNEGFDCGSDWEPALPPNRLSSTSSSSSSEFAVSRAVGRYRTRQQNQAASLSSSSSSTIDQYNQEAIEGAAPTHQLPQHQTPLAPPSATHFLPDVTHVVSAARGNIDPPTPTDELPDLQQQPPPPPPPPEPERQLLHRQSDQQTTNLICSSARASHAAYTDDMVDVRSASAYLSVGAPLSASLSMPDVGSPPGAAAAVQVADPLTPAAHSNANSRTVSRVPSRWQSTEDSIDTDDEWYRYGLQQLEEMERDGDRSPANVFATVHVSRSAAPPAARSVDSVGQAAREFNESCQLDQQMRAVFDELKAKVLPYEEAPCGTADSQPDATYGDIFAEVSDRMELEACEPRIQVQQPSMDEPETESPVQDLEPTCQPQEGEQIHWNKLYVEEDDEFSSGETSGPDSPGPDDLEEDYRRSSELIGPPERPLDCMLDQPPPVSSPSKGADLFSASGSLLSGASKMAGSTASNIASSVFSFFVSPSPSSPAAKEMDESANLLPADASAPPVDVLPSSSPVPMPQATEDDPSADQQLPPDAADAEVSHLMATPSVKSKGGAARWKLVKTLRDKKAELNSPKAPSPTVEVVSIPNGKIRPPGGYAEQKEKYLKLCASKSR